MTAVESAYAEVLRVTRREAKNFAYGIGARRLDGARQGAEAPALPASEREDDPVGS
jgi:hypothetical protein